MRGTECLMCALLNGQLRTSAEQSMEGNFSAQFLAISISDRSCGTGGGLMAGEV